MTQPQIAEWNASDAPHRLSTKSLDLPFTLSNVRCRTKRPASSTSEL